jgi:hypothetical protein
MQRPIVEIGHMICLNQGVVSLDASISEGGQRNSFSDLTVNENNINHPRQRQFEAMIYLVNMWLNKQDGLQSEELARRFGL